uniref:Uncharacterized protein n=1 Tax=Rangifer tarandus platyrhynchus TaxID=3082113 RepID=A0ACB0FLK3_RANTA|nr:unnamed protein product [Rangifer tarandus platyrhynchus]
MAGTGRGGRRRGRTGPTPSWRARSACDRTCGGRARGSPILSPQSETSAGGKLRACVRGGPWVACRWDILAYLVDPWDLDIEAVNQDYKRALSARGCLHGTSGLRAVPAGPGGRR